MLTIRGGFEGRRELWFGQNGDWTVLVSHVGRRVQPTHCRTGCRWRCRRLNCSIDKTVIACARCFGGTSPASGGQCGESTEREFQHQGLFTPCLFIWATA